VKQWKRKKWLRKWRNKVAYHVDADIVQEGLSTLISRGQPVKFAVTEDRSNCTSTVCFGMEAVLAGLDIDEEDFNEAAELLRDGHLAYSNLIHTLFMDVAQQAGLEVVLDEDAEREPEGQTAGNHPSPPDNQPSKSEHQS